MVESSSLFSDRLDVPFVIDKLAFALMRVVNQECSSDSYYAKLVCGETTYRVYLWLKRVNDELVFFAQPNGERSNDFEFCRGTMRVDGDKAFGVVSFYGFATT